MFNIIKHGNISKINNIFQALVKIWLLRRKLMPDEFVFKYLFFLLIIKNVHKTNLYILPYTFWWRNIPKAEVTHYNSNKVKRNKQKENITILIA